ncbi:MAG: bifunctional (p)ppGpp synthetase/guanosine-3',5'-bis(diphosphate) 3'-pyrophosphohydrolase [Armatimonadetes bacterium]|nr:bifunctional (p)ppGpp synthetase/guanosine-3',5'-bis(diphosphate) 3'-pyrophosphohydrolase [Armatimonadota bacterium]
MSDSIGLSEPAQRGLDEMLAVHREHWPNCDSTLIERAVRLADLAHEGQLRKSGEPYIVHPLHVAKIVAELGMDSESVVAAILHDVLEDTPIPAEDLKRDFGDEICQMIEGVTKLKLQINPEASARQKAAAETARAAESLRKLLLAMAADLRVMVIKLADRLHNMRTLGAMPPEKQTRIANETLEVYAPIAARLGIWQIKWQLEDLAFKILHPDEYQSIKERVSKSRQDREDELEEVERILNETLAEKGLATAKVSGRPKHLYSIYNKHVKQNVPWEEIFDLIAVRVICQHPHECYLALGLVYELWRPIPGLYSDYIQTPKPNGYQSLHTKVVGPRGEPLEVQIRTKQMHEIAEFGIAAHWTYKEGKDDGKDVAAVRFANLRKQLFDWSNDNQTSSDFLSSVSTDLFAEQVFAFTPGGDVIDMPRASTPIDFAFRVHTNLGERMVGAKINGRIVPLSTEIVNGDVIEIITRNNAKPSLDWLEHAKSAHARSKIRAYFRRRDRAMIVQRGRDALEKELRLVGLDPRMYMGDETMKTVLKAVRDSENIDDVFARIGEGLTSVHSIVDRIRTQVRQNMPESAAPMAAPVAKKVPEPTLITGGIDNVMVKRARCCQPVPGEDVIGYVTRGRGIMIHRRLCPDALALAEATPDRITAIKWEKAEGLSYPVDLLIICVNRQGLLMDIMTIFGESKTNVVGAKVKTSPSNTAEIEVTIDVKDTQHLRDLMTKISHFRDVISLLRVFGRGGKK